MSKVTRFAGYDAVDDIFISDDQWKDIEHAGRCKEPVPLAHRDLLRQALVDHAIAIERHANAPAMEEVERRLKLLVSAGRKMSERLKLNLQSPRLPRTEPPEEVAAYQAKSFPSQLTASYIHRALRKLASQGGDHFGSPPMKVDGSLDVHSWEKRFDLEVIAWTKASEEAIDLLKGEFGQPSRTGEPFAAFFTTAANVYEAIGGQVSANKDDILWSPFVRWLHALLACSNAKPKSINAVGASVLRVLKLRKPDKGCKKK
jgi:hypothetical protein